MNKQVLIIYNLPVLFNLLSEIKENFNFDLVFIDKEDDIKKISSENYLILKNSDYQIRDKANQLSLDNFPIKIKELIEKINISFLKQRFNTQSEIKLGKYSLNLNSREIFQNDKKLKLTEREVDIILFLKNFNTSQSIDNLQKKVWGHNSNLETHTVETHIYRLRKKINEIFKDENFIVSSKSGYKLL